MLALARVLLLPYLNLGCVVAGTLAVAAPFPAVAMAGLGLELAQVSQLPMGVALCGAWFVRLIPFRERWLRYLAPGAAYLALCAVCGVWDWLPLPGLVLGGGIGYLLPPRFEIYHRRGEVGVVQVRLEWLRG